MRNNPSSKIFFLLFAVVGALLTVLGSVMLIVTAAGHAKCTLETPAVVVEMRAEHSKSKGRTSVTYAPILEYEYHGEKLTYISKTSTYPPKYQTGQHVTVMLNPDDPKKLYIVGDSTSYILFGIFIGIGALFCGVGIFNLVRNGGILRAIAMPNKRHGNPPSKTAGGAS